MREYNIVIKQRLDINDAYLSKDLVILERWNNLRVADEDPGFREEYNRVIRDGSIPNGEDDIEIYDNEKEYSYANLELGLPRKDDDGLINEIVKKRKRDG